MLENNQPMGMNMTSQPEMGGSGSVHEIFNSIAEHMQKGLSVHEQLANYYDFLGMDGFSEEHEHHYNEEAQNLRNLNRYYLNNYDKMLNPKKGEEPSIIPQNWYKHTRNEVDPTTKRSGVENGIKQWRDWESNTKHEYEKAYKQLMDMNETSAAFFVKDLIDNVAEELETVNKQSRKLKDEEFDLKYITELQDKLITKNQNSGSRRTYDQPESEYRRSSRNYRYTNKPFNEYY